MAHLGDDAAAYVDGQLSSEATRDADAHLTGCERCTMAVRQQRMLKERMRGREFAVPSTLVASLSNLASAPVRRTRWAKHVLGGTLVALGASLAVLAAAYASAPRLQTGDPVAPRADSLAGIAAAFGRPGNHLAASDLDELNRAGWPSRERLGFDHYRLDGRLHDGRDMVAQLYAGRSDVLVLVEQVGSLAVDALDSFRPHVVGDRQLWVREGQPRVITWDADGMVYALVTSLPDQALGHILDDLPAPTPQPTLAQRVGDGLVRMSSWVGGG